MLPFPYGKSGIVTINVNRFAVDFALIGYENGRLGPNLQN